MDAGLYVQRAVECHGFLVAKAGHNPSLGIAEEEPFLDVVWAPLLRWGAA